MRAVRGFNGDIGRRLRLSRTQTPTPALGRAVARKSLLAAAGLHSALDGTWTTDRLEGAAAWMRRHSENAERIAVLERWSDDAAAASPADVATALRAGGLIEQLAVEFAEVVGVWDSAADG